MDIPKESFAKVTYWDRDGYYTQAYIDTKTGLGENKHTGIEIQVAWDDKEEHWYQIDTWEWDFDFEGTPTRRDLKPTPPPRETGQRWQPRRKNRRKK